jgi:hypothetical protein
MPDSLSQTNIFGTAPRPRSSCHIPASRSPVVRVGISIAMMNPDQVAVMVRIGGPLATPAHTGTIFGGNHRSHCTISPATYSVRSEGSAGVNSGRNSATLARSTEAECSHPIRSATTLAGIVGVLASSARICGSNASAIDPGLARWYFGAVSARPRPDERSP